MSRMITQKPPFLFTTLTYVGWSLFWLLLWDIFVTAYYMLLLDPTYSLPSMPVTLMGSALVVLISFRNSSAYNRWWEARTLWGGMTNYSRSYARQVLTLIDDPQDKLNPVKPLLLKRHVAYLKSLSAHLRGEPCPTDARELIDWQEQARSDQTNNFPNDLLTTSAALLAQEHKEGRLDSIRLARLESTMVELSNCQGGMERIANTPLPFPYVYFPRFFISLFCIIVPIGLVETLHWFTPLVSTVVGYMLLAIETVGTHLQNPFHDSELRIQTETICQNIERNLNSMLRDARDERLAAAGKAGPNELPCLFT